MNSIFIFSKSIKNKQIVFPGEKKKKKDFSIQYVTCFSTNPI